MMMINDKFLKKYCFPSKKWFSQGKLIKRVEERNYKYFFKEKNYK